MDIEALRHFIVLAESESVSQAARKLYVAQSALSKQLKALEKECDALLIERDYHNYRLTESGRILYERAMKIVELADAAVGEVQHAETGEGGTLNIAVTPSLATGILRDIIRKFREIRPAVTVKIFEGSTPSVLGRIEDGSSEVALVRTPYTQSPSYESEVVDYDKMVVLSTKTLHSTIDYEELFSMPLILTHRYTAMLARIAERHGLMLDAPVQCEEIATCISLAEAGAGATMIPLSTYENHRRHGLKLNAAQLIGEECDTRCELLHAKSRRLSAAAQAFMDIVPRANART